MRDDQVSQTALKVAATLVALGQHPRWRQRLPSDMASMSEQLVLAAREPMFSRASLRLSKRRWALRLAELGERWQPGTFHGLGQRKLFMERQVLAAIDAGASQVLVVGAGFDTLCLRLSREFPQVSFFEVDHPGTSAAKRRGTEKIGRPENMTLVAADLASQDLSDVLRDCAGWDKQQRSVVVAEGLLYYLPADAVKGLFREIAAATGPGTRVSFSHITGFSHLGMARAAMDLLGEPWLSAAAVPELPEYLGPGWEVLATEAGRGRDLEGFAVVARTG